MSIRTLQEFASVRGRLTFPQPAVSRITDVPSETLTAWTRRGVIHSATDKSRRVKFSGSGVLRIVTIRELAWIVGPARAGQIADGLTSLEDRFFEAIGQQDEGCVREAVRKLGKSFLVLQRPEGSYETARPIEGQDGAMGSLNWYLRNDPPETGSFGKTHAVVPLGRAWVLAAMEAGAFNLGVEPDRAQLFVHGRANA
ncbi:MAG TPA: MerR family transcriptional regulator [Parvularculaceae bacterium]|nr:MerR family transcriptional regulator [Parvularculaceae bacterium]